MQYLQKRVLHGNMLVSVYI